LGPEEPSLFENRAEFRKIDLGGAYSNIEFGHEIIGAAAALKWGRTMNRTLVATLGSHLRLAAILDQRLAAKAAVIALV